MNTSRPLRPFVLAAVIALCLLSTSCKRDDSADRGSLRTYRDGDFSGVWSITDLEKIASNCDIDYSGGDNATLEVEQDGPTVTATSSDPEFRGLIMRGTASATSFSLGAFLGGQSCDPPANDSVPLVYKFTDFDATVGSAAVTVSLELSCPRSVYQCKASFRGRARRL